MRRQLFALALSVSIASASAQEQEASPKPLTMADYEKAKSFRVKDLDADTYVKIDNAYVLDRYEMRKPYFITGDDGLKKRIDLYKLISRQGMSEMGTMIFYTNEKGKLYAAIQPNFTADPKVWEKYFEDIHAIDREEKNFVLKLSYVLSKEMSFQLYKSLNQGRDLREESGTYGTDICFPGNMTVQLANGSQIMLSEVKAGDEVLGVNQQTGKPERILVKKLVEHDEQNYAITTLTSFAVMEVSTADGIHTRLLTRTIEATPNHPIETSEGIRQIGEITIGQQVFCYDDQTQTYRLFTVANKTERAGGVQKVYNMIADTGTNFLLNSVVVQQK